MTKYEELLLKEVNIKVENNFDQIWGISPAPSKKKRKISIKDENSFDQIWGTSPTHFRLPLLRSNFQPATKSAAIIFFIFMSVIITITITAIILVINVIMITILK